MRKNSNSLRDEPLTFNSLSKKIKKIWQLRGIAHRKKQRKRQTKTLLLPRSSYSQISELQCCQPSHNSVTGCGWELVGWCHGPSILTVHYPQCHPTNYTNIICQRISGSSIEWHVKGQQMADSRASRSLSPYAAMASTSHLVIQDRSQQVACFLLTYCQ